MKIVKPGMYVYVLEEGRYYHRKVETVTDQDAIESGGLTVTRLPGQPVLPQWCTNRFARGD